MAFFRGHIVRGLATKLDCFVGSTVNRMATESSAESVAGIRLETKPVVFTRYEPMERKY